MGSGAPANRRCDRELGARASSHGCSCSHAHSSIPTSRRRPPLRRRTSSEPRRRSRSASPSARASWMRSPACHSTTNQSAQTTSVQAVADLAHNRNDSSIFGRSAGYRRPLSRGASGAKSGLGPTRLCELRGLRQLRGHLPLAREDRGQSSRRPVGGVLLLAVRRAQLGDDRPGERRQRQRPVMGMRGALLLLPNGKVASLAGFRYRRGCAASDPSHVAPRSLVLAASLVRSDLWLTQREVRLAGIVWCSQRGDCSAVRSYRQSRRRYEAGGIY